MKSKVSYIERFVKRIIISILMIRIKCSENRVHQQQVNKIQTHWGSYSQRMQFFLEENLNFTQPEVIKQVKKKKKKKWIVSRGIKVWLISNISSHPVWIWTMNEQWQQNRVWKTKVHSSLSVCRHKSQRVYTFSLKLRLSSVSV